METYFLKREPGRRLIKGKCVVLLVMLFTGIGNAMGQQDTSVWKSHLQQATVIEGRCLGYACHQSKLFASFDSLTRYYTAYDFKLLMSDSNYVAKYYAFLGLLLQDDSLAFEMIQSYISDTSSVYYFAACSGQNIRFNEEIITLYKKIISMKYQYGGRYTFEGFFLNYSPKNIKAYRNKIKELNNLLEDNGVSINYN